MREMWGAVQDIDSMQAHELISAEEAFYKLASYTNRKRRAMLFREVGSHARAGEMEAVCERIYDQLPHWAQW
jgi:hypothetical protein